MQIKAYSRPGAGDECDQGQYEYNGSFEGHVPFNQLAQVDAKTLEAWAKMMDCFQEVLFLTDRNAINYSRTWDM